MDAVDVDVLVRGTDAPGRTFASYGDIHVGVQLGREAVGLVPGDTRSPQWRLAVRVVDGDFRGPAVHGRRGDRFLYLTWADRVGEEYRMFRRGKLMLDRIDPAVVAAAVEGRTLVATVSLTDSKGGPRCARYDPPAVVWTTE